MLFRSTEFMKKSKVPLPDTTKLTGPTRGIFKFRLADKPRNAAPAVKPGPFEPLVIDTTTSKRVPLGSLTVDAGVSNHLPLESRVVDTTTGDDALLQSPAVDTTISTPLLREATDSEGSDSEDGGFDSDWDDDLDF